MEDKGNGYCLSVHTFYFNPEAVARESHIFMGVACDCRRVELVIPGPEWSDQLADRDVPRYHYSTIIVS